MVSKNYNGPKLVYDQTQSSAHPCAPRPKLQGLDGISSELKSGSWSGVGLIGGQFGLKSLIIGADSNAIGSDQGQTRAPYFFIFFFVFFLLGDVGSAKMQQ